MANSSLEKVYAAHVAAPFPKMGGRVGLFAAYDGFIAGYASRAVQGEQFASSLLPEPDYETAELVHRLRAAPQRSAVEEEFIRYFDLLERMRDAIADEPVNILVPLLDEEIDVWIVAKGKRTGPRRFMISSFEIDPASQGAKPAFAVGRLVAIKGGDALWSNGAVIGATERVAVRAVD